MHEEMYFFMGLTIGGLAVYLFYLGRIRELNEELDAVKRAN